MAVDMFLKIDDIKGESADDKHKGEIDVYSWSWGATQVGSSQTASGSGSGKANVADLTFTTRLESSIPPLLAMLLRGKPFKQAVLTLRKAGDKPLEYLKVTMSTGIVSSVQFGGGPHDEHQSVTVSLNFAQVKVDYTPQAADGSGQAVISAGHDVAANKPL
jgi:type VI secretion system secreted protein Hcp